MTVLSKIKYCFTILVISLLSYNSKQLIAQSPDFIWAKSIGGSNIESSTSIVTDTNGNVFLLGKFQGTADFDTGIGVMNLTSNGWTDIYIEKLDTDGDLIWAKSIGGIGYDYGNSIAVDNSGNIIITGSFEETVDFDPGVGIENITSLGGSDSFIIKLDSNGNFIWAKNISGNGNNIGNGVDTDLTNNIYVTGSFVSTTDFDPSVNIQNHTSNGSSDIFILKLDENGNFIWANTIGGINGDEGSSIVVDQSGDLLITGYFQDSFDFDPDVGVTILTADGLRDIYLLKMDASGVFTWAKEMKGISMNQGSSITSDNFNNCYITGYFQGTVDFDPSGTTYNLTSSGVKDFFIEKLDSNGNLLWVKSTGGVNSDEGNSIAINNSGEVLVTGVFKNTVDFNPGIADSSITSNGFEDAYILKLGINGDFKWTYTIGGNQIDKGTSVTVDNLGNIYATGSYTSTVDFDAGPNAIEYTSAGNSDAYVIKLSDCFIGSIDNSISQTGIVLTANANGYSFQWIDCDNGDAEINGETNQSFTPTVNGNYAVEISSVSCTETSACIVINSVGVEENINELGVNIYPNPSTGEFTIEVKTNCEVETVNVIGEIVFKQNLVSGANAVDISTNPNGFYFINVKTKDAIYSKRIVLSK